MYIILNKSHKFFFIAILFLIVGCDLPKTPNFKTSHKIEAPVLLNKEYQLLGENDAIIDTTSDDFSDMFVLDGDEHIILTFEEDFDMSGMDEGIPEIEVDASSIDSKIGPIEIVSFSSGGTKPGAISFEEITGQDPAMFPQGTLLPGGATANPILVDVSANLDFFEYATIIEGQIDITLTNNFGFDLNSLEVILYSGNDEITSTVIPNVLANGETVKSSLIIPADSHISNIHVGVKTEWFAQNIQSDPDELSIDDIKGDGLTASNVYASVEPQKFESNFYTDFDNKDFSFNNDLANYVELDSGTLNIGAIFNGLDMDLDTLIISIQSLRYYPYTEADTLIIEYSGAEKLFSNSQTDPRTIDLKDYRIYAPTDEIVYSVVAVTENTQNLAGNDKLRLVDQDHSITSEITITDLSIKVAKGAVKEKHFWLNDDLHEDDIIDILNDEESEFIELDGMESFSKQIEGIEFANPVLSLNYDSNVGSDLILYMTILGTNEKNEKVYLSGANKDGTYETPFDAPVTGMVENGQQIPVENILKIDVDPSDGLNLKTGSLIFNKANSNVDKFFNSLPTSIRLIGKAVINPNEENVIVNNPIIFEPSFNVDVPLNLVSDGATFVDTLETDLSELPGSGDKSSITEGVIEIKYTNGLPIGIDFVINFMDENDNIIFSSPSPNDVPFVLQPADIDANTSFATSPNENSMVLSLDRSQLNIINQTRNIEINALLLTSESAGVGQSVKLRATDKVIIGARAKITIETDIK